MYGNREEQWLMELESRAAENNFNVEVEQMAKTVKCSECETTYVINTEGMGRRVVCLSCENNRKRSMVVNPKPRKD